MREKRDFIRAYTWIFGCSKRNAETVYKEQKAKGNDAYIDRANSNPSRMTRLPGVTRKGKCQTLVAVNVGLGSWKDWENYADNLDSDLPEAVALSEYENKLPSLPAELIGGILREGHKMLIAGPSKAGKCFLLMQLCIAIAEGLAWLGFQCTQGVVFYINLEIDGASAIHRFFEIYEALGIPKNNLPNIVLWNLRGHAVPLDKLVPYIIGNCSVHPRINIKFQKEKREVMSNNKS